MHLCKISSSSEYNMHFVTNPVARNRKRDNIIIAKLLTETGYI